MKAGIQFVFVAGILFSLSGIVASQSLREQKAQVYLTAGDDLGALLSRDREQRQQVYSTARPQTTSLKVLGIQAAIYARDHNGKLPNDLKVIESWMHLPDVTGTGYSFNNKLLGADRDQIERIAGSGIDRPAGTLKWTVLFYEGQDGQLNFQHNGFALVCFLGGAVLPVNKAEAEFLRWAGLTKEDLAQYKQFKYQDQLIKDKEKRLTEERAQAWDKEQQRLQQRNRRIEQTSVAAVKQFSLYGRWKNEYNDPELDLHRDGRAIYYPESGKPKPWTWQFTRGELTLTVEAHQKTSWEILKYRFIPRAGGSKIQVLVDHTLFRPAISKTPKKWTDEVRTVYLEWSE